MQRQGAVLNNRQTSHLILLLVLTVLCAGCNSVMPISVDPLEYDECLLLWEHGFLESKPSSERKIDESCGQKLTIKDDDNAALMRNELQNKLMNRATDLCTEFKASLKHANTAYNFMPRVLAIVSSGWASVHPVEQTSKALAATSAALDSGALAYNEIYKGELTNIAISGIELARKDVFLQAQRNWEDSMKEYPLSRAINDAKRYHDACSLEMGLIRAGGSVNRAAQSVSERINGVERDD